MSASVEDAGDEMLALQHLLRGAREADVVAGVLGKKHLVAGRDAFDLRAAGGDDAAAAMRLEAARADQPGACLGLLLGGLDDDEVVERLEGKPRGTWTLQH